MTSPATGPETLVVRERYRETYLRQRDPIAEDRLLWRAQTFRQLVHLLPGQSVLELGCGTGRLTRHLHRVSRGENPITAVSFLHRDRPADLPDPVRFVHAEDLPGPLAERQFDLVLANDLLDSRNCAWLLTHLYQLLRPGGELVFYETNPWNVVLRLRRAAARLVNGGDPRALLDRPQLYELMSEVGFVRIFAVYNDFVYAPLTERLAWMLRNLSVLLENTPGVRTLAGAILLHAQKPPRQRPRPRVSLAAHAALRGRVSVVIPCHNERMNVGPLITRLRELFDDYLHEIIAVNDNSQDDTGAVLEALAAEDPRIRPLHRHPPAGVGRAIRAGLRAASGDWILSMDADFQHLLPEIRDLFDAAVEGYDMIVGSRFSRHSVLLNYPSQKIFANRLFHVLAQLVLLRSFRDLTNNLKLMRRDLVRRLELVEPGFAINAEIGLQALVMGYQIKEVPISWINRTPDMGASSFALAKVGGGYARVLARVWTKAVFGRGRYRILTLRPGVRHTWRGEGPLPR